MPASKIYTRRCENWLEPVPFYSGNCKVLLLIKRKQINRWLFKQAEKGKEITALEELGC